MTPQESLQYISQALSDYARTMPPSVAMPFQQAAQEAVNVLVPFVTPPPVEADPPPPLRVVKPE